MSPRVAILGAGNIGQWIGGHLAHAGVDVVLIGRSVLQRTVDAGRLRLTDVERDAEGFELLLDVPSAQLKAVFDVQEALRQDDFDAVFVCLKMNDNKAAAPLGSLKRDTVIISLQNGVDNQQVLSELLPHHTVVAGMVPYGVVELSLGDFRRGTFGPLAFMNTMPGELVAALRKAGLAVELHKEQDMRAVQWFKLVVNLGNALNAIVGKPLDSCMNDGRYRCLMAAVWEEGLTVLKAAGIRIEGEIQGQPLEKAAKLLRLPSVILKVARVVKGVQAIDASYHSSMFYDLENRRQTELNELNERIVKLGREVHTATPMNQLLVRLTRDAEGARLGSPRIPIEQILVQAEKEAPGILLSRQNAVPWLIAGGSVAVVAVAAIKLSAL